LSPEREPAAARVRVGRIVRPHGLHGEVLVRGSAFTPQEFAALGTVHLVRDRVPGERRERVGAARGGTGHLLVRFDGVESLEAAAALRGTWVEAERSEMPDAGEGRIYHFDLLGLEVVDESGRRLGVVRRVIPTGAHEVLEIDAGGGELLLPYHPETVLDWNPSERRLVVRLPAGLEDVYRAAPRREDAGERDASA
jgi:16S rRNA processing protein RimM